MKLKDQGKTTHSGAAMVWDNWNGGQRAVTTQISAMSSVEPGNWAVDTLASGWNLAFAIHTITSAGISVRDTISQATKKERVLNFYS